MPLGALIGGAASIIGSAFTAKQQEIRQQEALDAQREENQKNREWQERMWQEHESPQAQAQNMRAAGLNPMGQVSSQSVGSASTASLPTPQPSTIGDGIAQAGQLVASGLQARKALQLQRDQFNQQVTEQNRRFLLDLEAANLNYQEKLAIINSKIEEVRGMKIDNDIKDINLKMLEDFANAGGNTFKDESEQIQAAVALAKKEFEYYDQNQSLIAQRIKSEIASLSASARSSLASAKNQEYQNVTDRQKALISNVVGFDISILPPGAQALISGYVTSYVNGKSTEEQTTKAITELLQKLSNSETYINGSMSFSGGLTSVSTSQSYNANQ